MKKVISVFIIIMCSVNVYASEFVNTKDYLKINVPAAVVIDNDSHRILYDKNAHEIRNVASLTKVMTCILLLENCLLDDVITVPDSVVWIGGSSLGLNKGDKVTAYNLLVGMLLPSGNDAAYTTAMHIGGSVERFAEMMTERAKQLGAVNTSFKNPHGLDAEGHYSTAYDMALLTSHALKYDVINKITDSTSLSVTYGNTTKIVSNTNRLLRGDSFVDGVKTGFTGKAGRCLISSGTINDFRIITVVLGADDTNKRFDSAINLLNKTYALYVNEDLSKLMNWYVKIPVIKGENNYYETNIVDSMKYPIMPKEYENIYIKQNIIDVIYAPMTKDTYIGNIQMYIGDEMIYQKDVFLEYDIQKRDILDYFKDGLNKIFRESNVVDSGFTRYIT